MKALVLESDKILTVHDREMPQRIRPNDILIKVAACGVCGSDIPRGFQAGAYHYPLVMGHEFSGVVAEDKHPSNFTKGDKVAIFPLMPCNTCAPCQTGDYAQCLNYNYFGSRCDGGFSEYLFIPERNLFKIPEHVNILHAAMVEPAAVALHGVRKLNIKAGDTGLVFGAGPIGNMTAQWLRIHGCKKVIIADIDDKKLEIAADMGFEAINSKRKDAVKLTEELTDGRGADRVVEAVGMPATFLQAIQATARFGEVVFMGNIHGTFSIGEKDFSNILRKELTIYGTWNSKIVPVGTDDWTTVLKYMDRELEVGPLISDLPSLDEGQSIFNSIINKNKFHNKVIFKIAND
ncbi:galactitol-1-phosphate 5-dehydrogenase [Mucilaginibacter hurinus]|uniref:Galactitol-1-phosphate 5-dehydrogenase n=1 Tax=Mucilaginibacter hurinus TaxID=2201324 RepID=A0A367GQJ5_9SPHI|nr:galactitol-1-phosphate 5-dehydrogenase [Mucilaginibacter hurinus]RCH55348.1 galactitol-1-phosphate 5-dehydrogenase [Mucilaginibacter hurinus]